MYSYGPPHMAEQKQDDQLEHTYSSYVRIQDVALRTYQRRWTIGKSGERGSGIYLCEQHDMMMMMREFLIDGFVKGLYATHWWTIFLLPAYPNRVAGSTQAFTTITELSVLVVSWFTSLIDIKNKSFIVFFDKFFPWKWPMIVESA